MRTKLIITLVLTWVAGLDGAAGAADLVGPARVIDGDTLEVAGDRVRLWGIDAPEGRQTCTFDGAAVEVGGLATRLLEGLLAGESVRCIQVDIDRYGRVVARCAVEENDLGSMMVNAGWARDYVQYSNGFYQVEETAARSAGRGLWRGECLAPWEWRRRN